MPDYTYGLSTDFNIRKCRPLGGDNQWLVWTFGCDYSGENNFRLERNGKPVCGSRNCANGGGLPDEPGACWGNFQKRGEPDGSISLREGKDNQIYGRTRLFVETATRFSVPCASDVADVWLNDVYIGGRSASLTLSLEAGWNILEFTCYNQNDTARIDLQAPLASFVDIMDSDGCAQ